MNKVRLEKFANALLKVGVNLQPGENVLVETDTNCLDLAREITKQAYQNDAKNVVVNIMFRIPRLVTLSFGQVIQHSITMSQMKR